jgi:hypothetical protein
VAQDGPSVGILMFMIMSLRVPFKADDFFDNLTECRCLKGRACSTNGGKEECI